MALKFSIGVERNWIELSLLDSYAKFVKMGWNDPSMRHAVP